MSKVLVTEDYLGDIADAIRAKLGVQTTYKPGQMAAAIGSIPTGITPTGTINITENGSVDVTQYATADVQVSGGGGGGATILSGTSAPTASQGVDGDIYLQCATIPDSYTRLDYIESSGTQYIDTGKTMSSNTKVRLIEQSLNSSSTLQGVYTDGNTGVQFGCYNSMASISYGVTTTIGISYDINSSHEFIVDPANGKAYFDANEISKTYSGGVSGNIMLFGMYAQDRGVVDKYSARVFLYEHYTDGTLDRYMLPVKRNSDDVCGMYDVIGGTFYQNSGSGSFIPGNASSASVQQLILYAYLKVSGAWQDLIGSDISDVGGVTA